MRAVISFDVEQDCPPYLDTWRGNQEGLPRILDLLAEHRVRATFFFTGESIEKFPGLAKRVVDEGHELGVHGYRHERLDRLPYDDAAKAIEKATRIARRVSDEVVSFRAPNLRLPERLYPVLAKLGYRYDSSRALYKPPVTRRPVRISGILVIPATTTSSVLRLPWSIQELLHRAPLGETRVYFSHPWEYVDMTRAPVRWDCRFNTGEKALQLLSKLIEWLKARGAEIITLGRLGEQLDRRSGTA